ncbi:FAD-dependent oxidoreductase [bacterium]|nr:FAD-dependent oxidoreductase [bacterium]
MNVVKITIDNKELTVPDFLSVRKAALKNGIYVPGLCSHPELNPFKPFNWSEQVWQGSVKFEHEGNPPLIAGGDERSNPPPLGGGGIEGGGAESDFPHCDLCLVSVDGGEPQRACTTKVAEGMQVRTTGDDLTKARRNSLRKILANHPHACLTCAQREGCSRTACSMNVAIEERCCELLGRCEIGKVAEFIGIPSDTPAYRSSGIKPVIDEPLFVRDYEICINCMRCVRVCRDIRGVDVLGAVMSDGKVHVGVVNGSTLNEADCRYCTACVEICPTGALRDKKGLEPLVDGKAPCVAACPLHINIPGYLDLVYQRKPSEALKLIRQQAVLPGVLGYACFHPCEDVCRRGEVNETVSICAVKRYASDIAGDEKEEITKLPDTGKKVAVIGGGPAGLAAAAELLHWGHSVTIFDKDEKLGGMLRQTIPKYRLPDSVIDRDLKYLFDLGLETRLGVAFGSELTADNLIAEGFDAIIIAAGLSEAMSLNITGEQQDGVTPALNFLRESNTGETRKMTDPVIVIGGGSVAVDTAMTALRSGAKDVTMVCLESEDEMPASKGELKDALEEGVKVMHRWGIAEIQGNGSVKGALLKCCTRVFNSQGKFSPEYDENDTKEIPAATVLIAVGQKADTDTKQNIVKSPEVFIAGDIATGPSSIVKAMADGKSAAKYVDKFLGGEGHKQTLETLFAADPTIGKIEGFAELERLEPERISASERLKSFDIYEFTYGDDAAVEEAKRCLRCQLRATLMKTPLPPDPWHVFDEGVLSEVPAADGVIILADEGKKTVKIAGASDIRSAVRDLLDDGYFAVLCRWELDPMYTKRESELLQAHLQAFGELPGTDDMDDLF